MKTSTTIWLYVWSGIIFLLTGCATLGQEVERVRDVERFSTERIEQLVAPLALYPDALLAQIFMAATYPFEVVQAARWVRQHPELTGENLQYALQQERWDPSVKSLTAFPAVLERLETELDWMEDLGNAFLGQQGEVMDAVQRLRLRARDAGHLESTSQQNVVVKDRVIVIKPTQPEVIYVPSYNPTMVFGDWHYPTMYYANLYRPPAAAGLLTFGFGAGLLFSQFDWDRRHVIVEHHNYYDPYPMVAPPPPGVAPPPPMPWRHDPWHRYHARYRDTAVAPQWHQPPPWERQQPMNSVTAPQTGFNTHREPNTPLTTAPMNNNQENKTPSSAGFQPYRRSPRPTVPMNTKQENSLPTAAGLQAEQRSDQRLRRPTSPMNTDQANKTPSSAAGFQPYRRSPRPTVPMNTKQENSLPAAAALQPEQRSQRPTSPMNTDQANKTPSSAGFQPYRRSPRPTVPMNTSQENSSSEFRRTQRPTVPTRVRPASSNPPALIPNNNAPLNYRSGPEIRQNSSPSHDSTAGQRIQRATVERQPQRNDEQTVMPTSQSSQTESQSTARSWSGVMRRHNRGLTRE